MGGGRIRVARKQKRRDTATGSGGQAGLRRGCDRRVLCAPDATPSQAQCDAVAAWRNAVAGTCDAVAAWRDVVAGGPLVAGDPS
jgi:hypothetical protein